MAIKPKYKIPDIMDLAQVSGTDAAYTIISNGTNFKGAATSSFSYKLPIPTQLNYGSEFRWSAEELGQVAEKVMSGLQNLTHLEGGAAWDNLTSAFMNSFGGSKQQIWKQAANMLQAENAGAVVKQLNKNNGQAYNPNEQLYFNGIGLRNFSFNWSIAPMSAEEAKTIKRIYRNLDTQARPNLTADKFYFEYPDYVNISVYVGGHCLLGMKNLAITSIDLNMAPDGPITWHEDGFPTSIELQINFHESQIITKDRVKDITIFGE